MTPTIEDTRQDRGECADAHRAGRASHEALFHGLHHPATIAFATDAVAQANHRSLARIIADLLNENEPLLKAEHDGATVTVRERGGPAVMRFTIAAAND